MADAGLVTATGVCLAVAAAMLLRLDDPWWAAISAWIVANPDVQALWLKGLMRIAGTLLGCVVGYVAAIASIGDAALQAALLFLFGYLMTLLRFRTGYSYAWLFFMLIPALLIYVAMSEPEGLRTFAIWRALEIVTGVVAAALAAALATAFRGSAAARRSLRDAFLRARPRVGPQERVEIHLVAVAGGATAVLIALFWSIFHLPALTQVAISLLVCLDRDLDGARRRGGQRLAGTALGGLCGLAVAGLGVQLLGIWLLLLFLGVYLFAALHHFGGDRAYIGTQGGVAFMLCLIVGNGPPDSVMPVIDRIAGMFCGILLLVVVLAVLEALVRRPAGAGSRAIAERPDACRDGS